MKLPAETAVLAYVRENPKRTAMEIAGAFHVPSSFLRPLLADLRARGVLFAAGRTRGTYYWVPTARERREAARAA